MIQVMLYGLKNGGEIWEDKIIQRHYQKGDCFDLKLLSILRSEVLDIQGSLFNQLIIQFWGINQSAVRNLYIFLTALLNLSLS